MSVFATFKKKQQFKAIGSEYITTENEPDKEDSKPNEQPVKSDQPEAI